MSEIKKGALQSPANTARTTGTIVRHVQNVDATGKVTPAGEAVGNAPFVKVTDGTDTMDVIVQNAAFGTASKGIPLFGKYESSPTTYHTGDAVPLCVDENGKMILSAIDVEIGAVELKDAGSDARASIVAANTARTTGTVVVATQQVDATGKVPPAGDAVGNAPFVKLTDGTSTITSFGGLGQSDTRGLYIIGIDKGTYTVNNGTWPINYTGFTGLTLDNFPHKIVNLTTGQAYSMTGATISSTQITPAAGSNTGLTEPATGDKLFIPVVQSVRAYDDAGDYLKVSNLDPDRNQILNNTQHSAITSATNGTGVYVADMRSVSCCVVASSVTSGGVITVKASPDNTNFATVSTVGSDGIIRTTQTISSSATTYYKVVNCDPMYLRADLTTRTDGTYTIYLQGRA